MRGTASDDGAKALVRMIQAVKQGWDFGITPDGPRGPLMELKPGTIALARKTGAWIVPVSLAYRPLLRAEDLGPHGDPLSLRHLRDPVRHALPGSAEGGGWRRRPYGFSGRWMNWKRGRKGSAMAELAVVSLSGGMDSCVTAAIARAQGYELALLHADYGQRTQARERQAFHDIADFYDVPRLAGGSSSASTR